MAQMRPADGELPQQLTASHVRAARFPAVRKGGYDPDAVHAYLGLVADEILRLHEHLAAARADAERVRRSLRQCQGGHAAIYQEPVSRPAPSPDWPINRS